MHNMGPLKCDVYSFISLLFLPFIIHLCIFLFVYMGNLCINGTWDLNGPQAFHTNHIIINFALSACGIKPLVSTDQSETSAPTC